MNLAAGRKAKRAAAYQAAIRYSEHGHRPVAGGPLGKPRRTHAEPVHGGDRGGIPEHEFRTGGAALDGSVGTRGGLVHARPGLRARILFFTAQDQNGPAIEAGLKALAELDIALPTEPEEVEASAVELQRELAAAVGRIEDLAHLPEMTDPRQLAIMRILMHLTAPAQRTNPALLKAIIGRMVLLSVRQGNSPMAAFAYGWHGALLCGDADGIETGYRFGRLSLEVLRQFHAPELEAKVVFLFNAYVRHWKEHARECIAPLAGRLSAGHRNRRPGIHLPRRDPPLRLSLLHGRAAGTDSAEADGVSGDDGAVAAAVPQPAGADLELRRWPVSAAARATLPRSPAKLLDESKLLPDWIEENNSLLVFSTLFCRTMLQYLFGDYAGAVASGRLAEDHAKAAQGLLYRSNHSFYYALALLAHHATADAAGRIECLRLAAPLIDQLRQWAALAPMNFAHKLALVEAEHARVTGENGRAMECFNDAIRLARENGYLQDEALVCEREAVFYNALGREDIAGFAAESGGGFQVLGGVAKGRGSGTPVQAAGRQAPAPLDTAAVVEASHMLSQEIRLEQLLEKLMRIVIENAGAEKGS